MCRCWQRTFHLRNLTAMNAIQEVWIRPRKVFRALAASPIGLTDYALSAAQGVNAPGAWNITTGSETTVAIVGYGVDINHAKLKGHIWSDPANPDLHGWNFDTNRGRAEFRAEINSLFARNGLAFEIGPDNYVVRRLFALKLGGGLIPGRHAGAEMR